MTNEKLKQIREWQEIEGLCMIANTILDGWLSYNKFLKVCQPTKEEKKYVDEILNNFLSTPEYKGKIIPGFNANSEV